MKTDIPLILSFKGSYKLVVLSISMLLSCKLCLQIYILVTSEIV